MERSIFLNVLGDSTEMKIIDFFIEHRWSDYTKTEIARWCEISRPTLYKIWSNLEKNKIIVPTRKLARATLYKLNEENDLVKALVEVDRIILKKVFEEMEQKKIAKRQIKRMRKGMYKLPKNWKFNREEIYNR